MQVQINTGHRIQGHAALETYVGDAVEGAVGHWSEHITRIEVHVSDENGDKSGKDDMRCMMEARLQGRQPVAVTEHAATLRQAVDGAVDKLAKVLESTLGRLRDQRTQGGGLAAHVPEQPEES